MSEVDNIVTSVEQLLNDLIEADELQLRTSRKRTAAKRIARELIDAFEENPGIDLDDWLLEHEEVAELFLPEGAIEARLRPTLLAPVVVRDAPILHNPELGKAILADPEDREARAVYADWLTENGDPRGELMALQLAMTAPDVKKAKVTQLRKREKEILARHRHLTGYVVLDKNAQHRSHVHWSYGFFDTAEVPDEHDLRALLALESTRFLRKLRIRERALDAVDDLLAQTPLPLGLRELDVRLPRNTAYDRVRALGRFDLGRALRGLVHIERVIVLADTVRLERLVAPQLRHLEIDALQLDLAELGALPALETLDIACPNLRGADALQPIFIRPPEHLTTLRLADLPRSVAEPLNGALRSSPLAKQLTTLDFSL